MGDSLQEAIAAMEMRRDKAKIEGVDDDGDAVDALKAALDAEATSE